MIDNETWKLYLGGMRKKQSAVRLGDALDARILALLPSMATPGHDATISDVIRGAVEKGLPALEKAYGVKPPADMSDPMKPALSVSPAGHRGGKVAHAKGEGK